MNQENQNRRLSIWRPVKPHTFVIPEGVNLIKAQDYARGYESPRGAVGVLSKQEIDLQLKLPGHTRAATRIQKLISDHLTNGPARRFIKKIGRLAVAFSLIALGYYVFKGHLYQFNMATDFFTNRVSSQASSIKNSLKMNNVKRTVDDTSLEFFRMDK